MVSSVPVTLFVIEATTELMISSGAIATTNRGATTIYFYLGSSTKSLNKNKLKHQKLLKLT